MSVMGLQDVEKIERFYLNSCTDLPLTLKDSLHQSFPALNVSVDQKQSCVRLSRISRSQSGRQYNVTAPESDAALETNNRAKLTFFKICDSLATGLGRLNAGSDSMLEENTLPTNEKDTDPIKGSCHLITMPSLSKDEFIKKLEAGMLKTQTESLENSPLLGPLNANEQLNPEYNEHMYAKSDSVLVKSMASNENDEVTSPQNISKSTTAIDDKSNKPKDNARTQRSSAAAKIIVTGILLLVFFGIVKNAASR